MRRLLKIFSVLSPLFFLLISCGAQDESFENFECREGYLMDCASGFECSMENSYINDLGEKVGTCIYADSGGDGDVSPKSDVDGANGDFSKSDEAQEIAEEGSDSDNIVGGEDGDIKTADQVQDEAVDEDGGSSDLMPPVVVFKAPEGDNPPAPLSGILSFSFDESVFSGSVSVKLFEGASEVILSEAVIEDGEKKFSYNYSDLKFGTVYSVKIAPGVRDKSPAKNATEEEIVWEFNSTADPDNVPASVTVREPEGAGAPISGTVVVTFDEPVLPESVAATIGSTTLVQISAEESDTKFTFSYQGLDHETEYTATVLAGVKDKSGNQNETPADISWTFTTVSQYSCVTSPCVSSDNHKISFLSTYQSVINVNPFLGNLASLNVTVNIDCLTRGSVTVALISPAGTSLYLHYMEDDTVPGYNDSDLNLNLTGVADWAGEPAAGNWTLEVYSAEIFKITLENWSIQFTPQ